MTRRRHEIKNLFEQISVSTGNNSQKLNKRLQNKILQFKELSENFENIGMIANNRSQQNLNSTGQQNFDQTNTNASYDSAIKKHNWLNSVKKFDKIQSESKTTADNSRNGAFMALNSTNKKKKSKKTNNREKVGKQMGKLKKKDNQMIMNLLHEQEVQ